MTTSAKMQLTRLGMIGALLVIAVLVFAQQAYASTLLADDIFRRPNQQFWGKSTSGQKWGGDANIAKAFSIQNNLGVITGGTGVTFNALAGPNGNDMEAWVTGTSNSFKGANFGVLLRVTPSSEFKYYKAFINGTSLVIEKKIGSTFTRLKTVPFAAKAGIWYIIDFKASGSWLHARVWQAGTGVPGWMASVYDTSLKGGQAGIRVDIPGATAMRFSAFKAVAY